MFAEVPKGRLSINDKDVERKKPCSNLSLYYIKQIGYVLPCVCAVIDHRRRQNVVRTSVTHSAIASCSTSYHILISMSARGKNRV